LPLLIARRGRNCNVGVIMSTYGRLFGRRFRAKMDGPGQPLDRFPVSPSPGSRPGMTGFRAGMTVLSNHCCMNPGRLAIQHLRGLSDIRNSVGPGWLPLLVLRCPWRLPCLVRRFRTGILCDCRGSGRWLWVCELLCRYPASIGPLTTSSRPPGRDPVFLSINAAG